MDVCRRWLFCLQSYCDDEGDMERFVSVAKVVSDMIAEAMDRIGRDTVVEKGITEEEDSQEY